MASQKTFHWAPDATSGTKEIASAQYVLARSVSTFPPAQIHDPRRISGVTSRDAFISEVSTRSGIVGEASPETDAWEA